MSDKVFKAFTLGLLGAIFTWCLVITPRIFEAAGR